MKILTVVGARPQFIKAGPVSKVLRKRGVHEFLVHTGQHYDYTLSKVFFDELDLPEPDVNLGTGSGSHAEQTARMLVGLEQVMRDQRPDWILTYGDTNSTLAASLTAAKLKIPSAHVEAGLRLDDRTIPEEINRRVADLLADLVFAPTTVAYDNLVLEGFAGERIHQVGDVMYDACLLYGDKADRCSTILHRLELLPGQYFLATVHRAENTDDPARLGNLIQALAQLSRQQRVILPLHPRTRLAIKRLDLKGFENSKVTILDPVGFLDMLLLEKNASLILTDSGGVQKEAFFYQVPCVTLFYDSPWVELLELGWNRTCVPTSASAVVTCALTALGTKGRAAQPYGDGQAAQRIVSLLEHARPFAFDRRNPPAMTRLHQAREEQLLASRPAVPS